MITQEALVDAVPDQYGSLSTVSAVELRDEARAVLAALADLPPKQRQVMAWSIEGFSPTEIADHLGVDSPSVRQNLAKARKHLKIQLGISEPGGGINTQEANDSVWSEDDELDTLLSIVKFEVLADLAAAIDTDQGLAKILHDSKRQPNTIRSSREDGLSCAPCLASNPRRSVKQSNTIPSGKDC